jgi:hypothetical protein
MEYLRAEAKSGKSREATVGVTESLEGFPDHGPMTQRVLHAAY